MGPLAEVFCDSFTSPVLALEAGELANGVSAAFVGTAEGLYLVHLSCHLNPPELLLASPGNAGVTAIGFPRSDDSTTIPNTIYAAVAPGRVMKSLDQGGSWSELSTGLPAGITISALAVDASAPNVVYAATRGAGIYKSTGGGAWTALNNGLAELDVLSLAIDPASPLTVYAGVGRTGGVFRSTNGGGRWTDISVETLGKAVKDLGVTRRYDGLPHVVAISNDVAATAAGYIWMSRPCQSNSDCNDGLSCTSDVCDPAVPADGCRHDFTGPDTDQDGIPDSCDPCPTSRNRHPDGDYDGDGALDGCIDNCPGIANADQRNTDGCPSSPVGTCTNPIDGNEGGDVCDPCPGCIGASCCTGGAARTVGSSGTTTQPLTATLGPSSVSLSVPPGTFSTPTSVSLTGVEQSAFRLAGTATANMVTAVRALPAGALNQYVTLTFRWTSAATDPNKVDVPRLDEVNLKLFHNGTRLGKCANDNLIACRTSDDCPTGGSAICQTMDCGSSPSCDRSANEWQVKVKYFSEYALGSDPCVSLDTAKLALKRIGEPAGDDLMTAQATFRLPAGTTFGDLQPATYGLRIGLSDEPGATAGTAFAQTLPAGLHDGTSGWRTNSKGTRWIYQYKGATPPGGIVQVKLLDKSSKAPGLVQLTVKGKGGAYAATTAVGLGIVAPGPGVCAGMRFNASDPTRACKLTGGGTGLSCRTKPLTPAHKRVFVSSSTSTGDLGGLSGADALCNDLAGAAGLTGTFKAWLSSVSAAAADRLTHSTAPYALVDGTVVATGWDDLTDGTLVAPLNQTELGVTMSGSVWTNATPAGGIGTAECGQWTSATTGHKGQAGSASATNAAWTDDVAFADCAEPRHIYCIEQ